MKYENTKLDKDGFGWTDYCCEGCRQYKKLKKRESDGKMLCKRCSNNQSLFMSIKKNDAKAEEGEQK